MADWELHKNIVSPVAISIINANRRKILSTFLPSISQPSIKPIPHQIEEKLSGPWAEVVYGEPQADICTYVLTPAQSDLKLRYKVPVYPLSRCDFAISQ